VNGETAAGGIDVEHRVAHIGGVIRSARQGRFTYDELAARAGVSTGLISQLERGRGNPSLVTLLKLANALGLPMSSFFLGPPTHDQMVVRKNQRMTLESPGHGLRHELLTPDFNRSLALMRIQIPPGFSNQERPFLHTGEEVTHVLSGQLEVVVGNQHVVLEEGDSITHESSIPHWWRNSSGRVTEIMASSAPPSF
jgi:transcriptional regulator with XRE-family HTH domain